MAAYSVRILAAAADELLALPFPLRRQVNQKICSLKQNPRPDGSEPVGAAGFRLRVHGRRLLYAVDDDRSVVTLFAIL